jgi:hypothetical protein
MNYYDKKRINELIDEIMDSMERQNATRLNQAVCFNYTKLAWINIHVGKYTFQNTFSASVCIENADRRPELTNIHVSEESKLYHYLDEEYMRHYNKHFDFCVPYDLEELRKFLAHFVEFAYYCYNVSNNFQVNKKEAEIATEYAVRAIRKETEAGSTQCGRNETLERKTRKSELIALLSDMSLNQIADYIMRIEEQVISGT